ncbi:OmpA family protein [Sulfurimonas sp. HSL-1716]|uniref:OmpA family protein n=1 Tax=Hydrocurvibacter sulfurireducens TaxID=3131937 RepID=UPI0031F7E30C
MKKRCKKTECPAGEKWAVPYADFLSLLLALFIALYALASVNKVKMEALKAAFVQIYSYAPRPQQMTPVIKKAARPGDNKNQGSSPGSLTGSKSVLNGGVPVTNQGDAAKDAATNGVAGSDSIVSGGVLMELLNIKRAVIDAKESIEKEQSGSAVSIQDAQDGFIINMPASLLFKKDSAKITDHDTLLFLKRIVLIIKQMPSNVDVLVNGYTDNIVPAKDSVYKDNWQLSSARALSVVKELVKDGVSGDRLGAVGYGEYRPVATNDTSEGRDKNRRVTISFMAKQPKNTNVQKQDILDQTSQERQ